MKSLKLLGLNSTSSFLLNEIAIYIFGKKGQKIAGKSEKNFDINLDYGYYYPDFLKYGIDLNKDHLNWWEFNKILNSILLDVNSSMHNVIAFRVYQKPPKNPKVREEMDHKYRMKMKQKYSLPKQSNPNTALEKLWNYVEKKAGEKKE